MKSRRNKALHWSQQNLHNFLFIYFIFIFFSFFSFLLSFFIFFLMNQFPTAVDYFAFSYANLSRLRMKNECTTQTTNTTYIHMDAQRHVSKGTTTCLRLRICIQKVCECLGSSCERAKPMNANQYNEPTASNATCNRTQMCIVCMCVCVQALLTATACAAVQRVWLLSIVMQYSRKLWTFPQWSIANVTTGVACHKRYATYAYIYMHTC